MNFFIEKKGVETFVNALETANSVEVSLGELGYQGQVKVNGQEILRVRQVKIIADHLTITARYNDITRIEGQCIVEIERLPHSDSKVTGSPFQFDNLGNLITITDRYQTDNLKITSVVKKTEPEPQTGWFKWLANH